MAKKEQKNFRIPPALITRIEEYQSRAKAEVDVDLSSGAMCSAGLLIFLDLPPDDQKRAIERALSIGVQGLSLLRVGSDEGGSSAALGAGQADPALSHPKQRGTRAKRKADSA